MDFFVQKKLKESFFDKYFYFKTFNRFIFINKNYLKIQKKENQYIMKYQTFLLQNPERKDEKCIICYEEMKEDTFIVKICENNHFMCFDCINFLTETNKHCFVCKEKTIKREENLQLFIEESIIEKDMQKMNILDNKDLPIVFYIENDIVISLEDTFFYQEDLVEFSDYFSIHITVKKKVNIVYKKPVVFFSEEKKINQRFKYFYFSFYERPFLIKKELNKNYIWINTDLNSLLQTGTNLNVFNFIEIKSFWENDNAKIEHFIYLIRRDFYNNFSCPRHKFIRKFINTFFGYENIVFCFIKKISQLAELSKKENKKYYLVFFR